MMNKFTAFVYKGDKFYIAECPETGTVSQGTTIEEALANIKEATELYLEAAGKSSVISCKDAFITTFEAAVNA